MVQPLDVALLVAAYARRALSGRGETPAQSPSAEVLPGATHAPAGRRGWRQRQPWSRDRGRFCHVLLLTVAASFAVRTAAHAESTAQRWQPEGKVIVDLGSSIASSASSNLRTADLSPEANVFAGGRRTTTHRFSNWATRACAMTACIAVLFVLISVADPGGRSSGGRQPPSWTPEREAHYPFRFWAQDLLAWSILSTDLDPAQQTAAIILQLGGAARDLARNLTYVEITTGGPVAGQPADPVTFLLYHLAAQFAPLGEEARLTAISELMQFQRNLEHRLMDYCRVS